MEEYILDSLQITRRRNSEETKKTQVISCFADRRKISFFRFFIFNKSYRWNRLAMVSSRSSSFYCFKVVRYDIDFACGIESESVLVG